MQYRLTLQKKEGSFQQKGIVAYLIKSFLRTRMRIVARNPVNSRTVTHELMMENQWISRCCGRKEYFWYFSIRFSKVLGDGSHLAENVNFTSMGTSSVISTAWLVSVETLISTTRSALYNTSKCTWVKSMYRSSCFSFGWSLPMKPHRGRSSKNICNNAHNTLGLRCIIILISNQTLTKNSN